ncbi:MAG: HAD family hydrolase [Candidatus Hydrogenedentes bacterium]|nr:HAD family hydrolase [Candidatus Hydrogenedentota bacterium]
MSNWRRRFPTEFATAILRYPPEPIEGALDAVQAASFRWPVGLISDSGVSPCTALRALLDRHGFTIWFDAMTFSDEVGVSKPQARMFETTAARLGVAPHEILHIGDLEHTDIAGIRAVGGKAAIFRGDNGHAHNSTKADYTLQTWEDFLDLMPDLV